MKKYIHYILFLVGITTFLSSCYDLDRSPYGEVKEEKFWENEVQVKQAMMGVYNSLKVDYGFGLKFAEDNMTDIGVGYDNQGYGPAILGTYTDRTALIENKWKAQYDCIQRANLVIRKTSSAKEISDSFKKLHISEAKFLRALAYFDLATFYGAVPLYDETVVLQDDFNNLKNPRSPLSDVYAFILKDLNDAINSELPVKWEKVNTGRATKGAAYALRAKVHLYMKNYDLAVKDFEEVILDKSGAGYGYSLHQNYAELFTREGDSSPEMIFAIQNSGGVGMDYGMKMTFYMGTRSTFGSCWNNVMPSVALADMYEMKDGKPFNWNDFIPDFDKFEIVTDANGKKSEVHKAKEETFLATLKKTDGGVVVDKYPKNKATLLSMYEQRDPRMAQTILLPYTKYNGWVSNTNKECEFVIARNMGPNEVDGFIRINGSWRENYVFRKFVPEGNMNGNLNNREHTPINFPLIRLADVYLMYAEAKSMLGDQTTAVEYINKVRQRPSTNLPALNSGASWLVATTQEQVMTRIKHERAVELVAEGHRFNDLRRWGDMTKVFPTASTRIDGILGQRLLSRSFTERDMLWPIPGVEIERNPLLKPNNPGWE